VFGKVHRSYQQHQEKMAADEESEEDLYNWDDFKPRLIRCSALLEGPDRAPWKQYAPILTTNRDLRAEFEALPRSMVLLLEMCSDVVDTTALALMQCVRNVEWYITQQVLPAFQQATAATNGD
jgi:hypothetical protein